MTAARATLNTVTGEMEVAELMSPGGVVSSTDYQGNTGVRVQDGIGSRTVTADNQLTGDEIITVEGMSMKVSQARELGLLNQQVFDDSLSAGAATAAREAAEAEANKPAEGSDTGYPEFDSAVDALNGQLEAGTIQMEEATEYEVALGEIALSNLDVPAVLEAVENGRDYSSLGLDAASKSALENAERTIEAASTKSAQAELGQQGFAQLEAMAAASPVVASAIVAYSVERAQGKADASWSEFLQDAADELSGNYS